MKIALIGSGSWGTAMAGHVAPQADTVLMWALEEDIVQSVNQRHVNCRYLKEYELPHNVSATNNMAEALEGADGVIIASPSTFIRSVAHQVAEHIGSDTPILCLAKGIEFETGKLMSEVIADEVGNESRVAALSGPNHAEEVCRDCLSASVVAALDADVAEFFKQLLLTKNFRVYVTDDMVGIETCGASKNVIALMCGMAVGYGYGDNTLALLMTRGLAEISRLVAARNGNPLTCMGLAGMGDLIVTCTSPFSRNRTFGEAFARRGISLDEYQEETHMVVEGAQAARSITRLARELGVDLPITFAVNAVLWEGASKDEVLKGLVDRIPNEEFYGL